MLTRNASRMSASSGTALNPPSLLLARTPPVPSTSTNNTTTTCSHHLPSSSARSAPAPRSPSIASSTPASHFEPLANLHPVFAGHGPVAGTVEIWVQATRFLVHKDVMAHASSFFETLLCGEWAETTAPTPSPRHPQRTGSAAAAAKSTRDSFATADEETLSALEPAPLPRPRPVSASSMPPNSDSGDFFLAPAPSSSRRDDDAVTVASSYVDDDLGLSVEIPVGCGDRKIEARVHLKEESAEAFQDLLTWIYPQFECICTWNNAPELMTMSRKFDIPLLQRHVLHFLLSSAAGKPIQAMRIAEEHGLGELYRESSRFLLDNWNGWDTRDLEVLSADTLLKLEKKRNWFLERLLKLGLINPSRDYVCPPSCPDPQTCARSVDEKWRSAWAAAFKFGPPQPSGIWRALRGLEPSLHSPALLLPHTACQQHAHSFFADLFDRMFASFSNRTSEGVTTLGLVPGVGLGGGEVGRARAKYFLSVTLWEGQEKEVTGRKRTLNHPSTNQQEVAISS